MKEAKVYDERRRHTSEVLEEMRRTLVRDDLLQEVKRTLVRDDLLQEVRRTLTRRFLGE